MRLQFAVVHFLNMFMKSSEESITRSGTMPSISSNIHGGGGVRGHQIAPIHIVANNLLTSSVNFLRCKNNHTNIVLVWILCEYIVFPNYALLGLIRYFWDTLEHLQKSQHYGEIRFMHIDQIELNFLLKLLGCVDCFFHDSKGHVWCQSSSAWATHPPGGEEHRGLQGRRS